MHADESEIIKLNQLTKIFVETGDVHASLSQRNQSLLFKHARLATERIENMKKDLSFLESWNVCVKLHVPSPALFAFIDSIVYCKGHNLGREYETTIPDGTAQMLITVGEGGREVINPLTKRVQHVRNAWVMGINNIPVTYRLLDDQPTIYVRFKPGGLYAFTKVHQATLNSIVIDANVLFGQSLRDLHTLISTDHTPDEVLKEVEGFFLKRLKYVSPKPALLDFMLDNLNAPLGELAKRTGYSSKYLTKTFQKHVGIGPKNLQRIHRFSRSMSYLNQLTHHVDWLDIVCENGYHDQAHFIRDFKEFTGFSPLNYLAFGSCCIHYLHSSVHPDMLVVKGILDVTLGRFLTIRPLG